MVLHWLKTVHLGILIVSSLVLYGTCTSDLPGIAPAYDGPPDISVSDSRTPCGADDSVAVLQSDILTADSRHVFPSVTGEILHLPQGDGPLEPYDSVSRRRMGRPQPVSPVLDDPRAPLQSPDADADYPRTLLPVSYVSSVPHLLTSPDATPTDVPGPPPATPTDVLGPPPAASTDMPGSPPTASTDVPGSPPTSSNSVQPIPSLMGTASPSCHDPDVPQRRLPYHAAGRGCYAPLHIDDAPWSPFLQYGCEDNRPPDDTWDYPSVTRMMLEVRYRLHVTTTLWMYLLPPSSGRISSPPYFLKPPPPPPQHPSIVTSCRVMPLYMYHIPL